jgi:pilus assembly protein CpaE
MLSDRSMRTLIVGRCLEDPTVGKLKQLLAAFPEFSDPSFVTSESVQRKRLETKAALAVVVLSEGQGPGQEVIPRLREMFTGHVIAVGEIADPKLILRSLQIGADLFVDVAELETEFPAALRRLVPRAPGSEPKDRVGNLVGVLSACGGCGASTVAVNLAAVQAREHGQSILIDLNLGRGDLAALLDLRPQFSVANVCLNEGRLDQAMFGKMLVRHSSGIHLLSSPPNYADARDVTASGVKQALSLARAMAPEVVVDLEDCFHGEQVEVLRQATGVLVVCRLDFTSLRNTRRILDHFTRLEIQRSRVKVVVNQHGRHGELPVDLAEDALNEKIVSFIPHHPKAVHGANNAGVPLAVSDRDAKVVKSIMELANISFEEAKPPSRLAWGINRLLGGVFNGRR